MPQCIRRPETLLLFTVILICHFSQAHCSQIILDYTESLCLIPAVMNQWAFMHTAMQCMDYDAYICNSVIYLYHYRRSVINTVKDMALSLSIKWLMTFFEGFDTWTCTCLFLSLLVLFVFAPLQEFACWWRLNIFPLYKQWSHSFRFLDHLN